MSQRLRVYTRATVPAFCHFAPSCLFFAMAASRQLVNISDDDLVKFSKENKNTAKKSEYHVHVRIFRKYLDTIQETRDITQMPFPDLQSLSEESHHSKI